MRPDSFEAACAYLGYSTALPDVSALPVKHQAYIVAKYKLAIIIECVNNSVQPDWSNLSQKKVQPKFKIAADGTRPQGYDFDGIDSRCFLSVISYVGARECFFNTDDMNYVFGTFRSLFIDAQLIP